MKDTPKREPLRVFHYRVPMKTAASIAARLRAVALVDQRIADVTATHLDVIVYSTSRTAAELSLTQWCQAAGVHLPGLIRSGSVTDV